MIKILDYTTKVPLQMIGELTGVCWGSNITNSYKNACRAADCIDAGHGRVEEFPDVYCIIEGYSARCLRELYTHIGGNPTRLQESTRYVNCGNFSYYIGDTIKTEEQLKVYKNCMINIASSYDKLIGLGVSKEDAANVLPLGMLSKMVWKVNLRTLVNFMNMRLCGRAYNEIRGLAIELRDNLSSYSPEWREIANHLFIPKCLFYGKCTEKHPCKKTNYLNSYVIPNYWNINEGDE